MQWGIKMGMNYIDLSPERFEWVDNLMDVNICLRYKPISTNEFVKVNWSPKISIITIYYMTSKISNLILSFHDIIISSTIPVINPGLKYS